MSLLYLREAGRDDAELLFSWANDIDVRRNAFHQDTIVWDEHMRWFQGKLEDKNCRIYIGCIKAADMSEKAVGQIRLDITDGRALIDYSVSADQRGKGYGTEMLRQLTARPGLGIRLFAAQVKTENRASARVFEKCGFTKVLREESCELWEKACAEAGEERERIVICTQKSFHIRRGEELREQYAGKYDVRILTKREELTIETLSKIAPKYLFFPHWSYLIPKEIYETYPCVVFHMTDLPFGRGGSPLQNLIVRGYTDTKISALRAGAGLDTGDIYMKEDLSLAGTADEILRRASEIIFTKMIPYLLEHDPRPLPQEGEPVLFGRRKPQDGRLLPEMDEKTIYDYIRMLDGEGYPPAFIELGDYTLRFREAEYQGEQVSARVTFEKKKG